MALSAERLAQVGIVALFLALARTVGEYYRLRAALGRGPGLAAFEPFIAGLLIAVLGAGGAVLLYFARRFRAAAGVALATVLALLAYRLAAIP